MIQGDGRALRFVGLVAGGWIAVRVALLWPSADVVVEVVRDILPLPVAAKADALTTVRAITPPATLVLRPRASTPRRPRLPWPKSQPSIDHALAEREAREDTPTIEMAAVSVLPTAQTAIAGPLKSISTQTPTNRLSVSAWLIVRSGIAGDDAGLLAPQLGGTQGGVRVDYAIAHGFAATARVAAPAAGAGREVSLGLAWRPKAVPIRIVAEHRFALDGGRGGPAIGVSGGFDALPLMAGFRLEAYGQAGTIFRGPAEHFVDASARATRAIGSIGRVEVDAGAGSWGGAQRGAARLDIGPSIGARVPIADTRLRIALDWRQRIAGNARPASGPALTLGTDF